MTREEFREKARNLIDNYQFFNLGNLFKYDNFEEEMKVAYIPGAMDSNQSDMPLVELLDDLYEQIKGDLSNSENPNKWIPVKWHNITDEERQREDYPKEWLTMLDCPMPNDEEEILVTVKSSEGGLHVEKDVCYVDDGFSLDSGYDWIDDVIAWMPLPGPYKAESECEK